MGAAALPVVPGTASALDYPTRPVHILVGFPAGSGPDIIARLVGQWLSDRFGQQFIIENRPGAGTNVATEIVVRAPADGYTLLLITSANTLNATLYENLNFNFIRDIAPVGTVSRSPFVMVVSPSIPAKTVPEFIAYAKANPGRINMASLGSGTATHVFGELFMMMTGVELVHVPYHGSMMPDLLAGQVQVLIYSIPELVGYIRAGKLRALAVTTTTRVAALPDIPTMAEFVPRYEASTQNGIGAPKGTATAIIEKLNKEISAAVVDPDINARFVAIGTEPVSMTPSDFGRFLADETEKWAKVIKFANIKPE